jgi:hypothetical protein
LSGRSVLVHGSDDASCPIADDRMVKNRTAINYYLAINALVGVVGVACVTGTTDLEKPAHGPYKVCHVALQ